MRIATTGTEIRCLSSSDHLKDEEAIFQDFHVTVMGAGLASHPAGIAYPENRNFMFAFSCCIKALTACIISRF